MLCGPAVFAGPLLPTSVTPRFTGAKRDGEGRLPEENREGDPAEVG